ncbi:MAG: DevR family CRISPR-associated autoregulator [Salinibacter sp.]
MIENILVTARSKLQMHRANSGQNRLGNASSIKQRPDGRVYISGQMQRHAFFEALKALDDRDDTYVSNGDATSYQVETDLRADLGGFMLSETLSGEQARRTAPLSATPAVAEDASSTVRDLLLRLRSDGGTDNNIATQELSQEDVMHWSMNLDLRKLSTSERYHFDAAEDEDRGMHVKTERIRHCDPAEKRRRAALFLEATSKITEHASQARNMTTAEPFEVLVVLDTTISRKAAQYFDSPPPKREAIRAALDARDADVFYGNDLDDEAPFVYEAFADARDALDEREIYDRADEQLPYHETYDSVPAL